MRMDFSPFFQEYEQLVAMADRVFEQVTDKHPECIRCKVSCSDCCFALFDITLIEALYINNRFRKKFDGAALENLLEKCNAADRSIYKIKKQAYKYSKSGKDPRMIVEAISEERVRCPMLNEQSECDIYDFRPLTCRLYGIPTSIGEESHTCGLSAFEKGKPYPTVKMDVIQDKLIDLSFRLTTRIKTGHTQLHEVLVPLSMALLTIYDESYLGIKSSEKAEDPKGDG
ncbi:MAG: YkgJ family cysteine cluster protein [Desulfatirhabdiaceae bacterium]